MTPPMTTGAAGGGEPEEVRRGLAELERFLTTQPAPVQDSAGEVTADAGPDLDDVPGELPMVGETARVRRMRAEVAEAHALVDLQADTAPLLIDSPKVRRRRRAVAEAARLHALGQDPAAQAWRAARWRRTLTTLAMTALILALGWSTAGVQKFAANGAPTYSAAWWLAWLVEPLISLALLFVVGARAFFASRGQALSDRVLTRIEVLFLGITITMNVWPYLPGVAAGFAFAPLLIHAIGPIVAVAVVTAMPRVRHGFTHLNITPTPPAGHAYPGATAPEYRHNTTPARSTGTGGVDLLDRAHDLIRRGALPARPSASQVRTALGCGTDAARRIRDALATSDPKGGAR
ncbi:MAG TPA: conjugal transfer protein TraI [Pseudonocardiaceae bacterium]